MNIRISTLFLLVFALLGNLNAAIVVPPVKAEATKTITTDAEAMAAAKDYTESIKSMSAKERRELKREQRMAVKEAIANHKNDVSDDTLLLVIITILLPPLGMYLYQGEANSKFWLSLVLWLLFYIPGLIYTLITILG